MKTYSITLLPLLGRGPGGGLRRIACFLIFNFSLLLFHSCEKPSIVINAPNEDIPSLAGFLGNNYDYTLFHAALQYTGLLDTLNSSQATFTVLAPDNAAFNGIGILRPSDFYTMDRDSLREVLDYHILPYRMLEDDVPFGRNIPYQAFAGKEVLVTKGQPVFEATTDLYFSGSFAESRDVVLSNGVLHTLDRVVKTFPRSTVQDWLDAKPEYATLVAGLKHFGLWDELAGAGPFTIFAPTNDMFLQLGGITPENIAAMDAANYVGERLFGSYIMYDQQIFTVDLDYQLRSTLDRWSVIPLRGDTTYNRVLICGAFTTQAGVYSYGSLTQIFSAGYSYDKYTYSLALTKLMTPWGHEYSYRAQPTSGYYNGFDEDNFLGSGTATATATDVVFVNSGLLPQRNDYICVNGIVHDLQAVLVLPEEALREND